MSFDSILNQIDDIVWGLPTIILILATGLILTIAARGIQFSKLGRAFKGIFKKNEGAGELSGFSALCTALSATIGTGTNLEMPDSPDTLTSGTLAAGNSNTCQLQVHYTDTDLDQSQEMSKTFSASLEAVAAATK